MKNREGNGPDTEVNRQEQEISQGEMEQPISGSLDDLMRKYSEDPNLDRMLLAEQGLGREDIDIISGEVELDEAEAREEVRRMFPREETDEVMKAAMAEYEEPTVEVMDQEWLDAAAERVENYGKEVRELYENKSKESKVAMQVAEILKSEFDVEKDFFDGTGKIKAEILAQREKTEGKEEKKGFWGKIKAAGAKAVGKIEKMSKSVVDWKKGLFNKTERMMQQVESELGPEEEVVNEQVKDFQTVESLQAERDNFKKEAVDYLKETMLEADNYRYIRDKHDQTVDDLDLLLKDYNKLSQEMRRKFDRGERGTDIDLIKEKMEDVKKDIDYYEKQRKMYRDAASVAEERERFTNEVIDKEIEVAGGDVSTTYFETEYFEDYKNDRKEFQDLAMQVEENEKILEEVQERGKVLYKEIDESTGTERQKKVRESWENIDEITRLISYNDEARNIMAELKLRIDVRDEFMRRVEDKTGKKIEGFRGTPIEEFRKEASEYTKNMKEVEDRYEAEKDNEESLKAEFEEQRKKKDEIEKRLQDLEAMDLRIEVNYGLIDQNELTPMQKKIVERAMKSERAETSEAGVAVEGILKMKENEMEREELLIDLAIVNDDLSETESKLVFLDWAKKKLQERDEFLEYAEDVELSEFSKLPDSKERLVKYFDQYQEDERVYSEQIQLIERYSDAYKDVVENLWKIADAGKVVRKTLERGIIQDTESLQRNWENLRDEYDETYRQLESIKKRRDAADQEADRVLEIMKGKEGFFERYEQVTGEDVYTIVAESKKGEQ